MEPGARPRRPPCLPLKASLWPWPLISGLGNKPRKVASAKGHRETTVMAPWGPGISNRWVPPPPTRVSKVFSLSRNVRTKLCLLKAS